MNFIKNTIKLLLITIYFFVFSFLSVIKTYVINSTLKLSILILGLYGWLLYYLDTNRNELFTNDFQLNILVEAHGLLFDLIIIAVFFEFFRKRISNKDKIEKLENDLIDYKMWGNNESKTKAVGALRRLSKINAVNIDLTDFDLSNTKLQELKFLCFDFSKTDFTNTSFKETKFLGCDFSQTKLNNTDFTGCSIQFSNLVGCKEFKNAKFTSSYITNDSKEYLEKILTKEQLANITWTSSSKTFKYWSLWIKSSIRNMNKAKIIRSKNIN